MGGTKSRKILKSRIYDRRRFARHYLSDDEVRVFSHSYKNFGWIMDISKGGLSIEYIVALQRKVDRFKV